MQVFLSGGSLRLVATGSVLLDSVHFTLGMFSQPRELALQCIEIVVGKMFEPDHLVTGSLDGSDQFIELEVNGAGNPILRVLDEEDHKKGDDRCSSVDDQL